MINKRIFGSDIPNKVKKKLALRQAYAQSTNPNESLAEINKKYKGVDGVGLDNEFDNQADLSSRTPFVRMWVGVEIFNRETDEDGEPVNKTSLASRIYVVGNHTLNQATANPNESVGLEPGKSGTDPLMHGLENDDIIPPEFGTNDNQYLKPPAGITSFTSTTEGTLGVMRKTTVGFTVHNFHDFDKIYQRYFLRPGAQIFVDYGWNTGVLYDPTTVAFKHEKPDGEDTATGLSVEEILYGEKPGDKVNGYVTEAQGDLDTLIGYVTNYDAKILENGSVECSVEITSKNIALLSEKFDNAQVGQSIKDRLQFLLDTEIDSIGVLFLTSKGTARDHIIDRFKNITPKSKGQFDYRQKRMVEPKLQFGAFKLEKNNVESGVGLDKVVGQTFMSWGFFEDVILNPEFGLGESGESIATGTNTEVRIDSSESFTSHDNHLRERQTVIGRGYKEKLSFLYPENWDTTFNTKVNKNPNNSNYDETILKTYKGSKTKYDILPDIERIPLREMFIDVSIVTEAIKNAKNLVDCIKRVCEKINTNSGDVYNWGISNNGSDNLISIIDKNYLGVERDIKDAQNIYDMMFEFDVMSSNSIVKGYDVSFTMPEGGISNMMAIQAMSGDVDTKIYNVNSFIDSAVALQALLNIAKKSKDDQQNDVYNTMGVGYYPDMGSFKAKKINNDSLRTNAKVSNTYDRVTDILAANPNLGGNISGTSQKTTPTTIKKFAKYSKTREKAAGVEVIIAANEEASAASGTITVKSISDYYIYRARSQFLEHKHSTPLPMSLTLTIYGISSIQPGDIFRVNYLPESYRNIVYFQVMKVTQAIDSSGWYTTLETQYRFRATDKIFAELTYPVSSVSLSVETIKKNNPQATKSTGNIINSAQSISTNTNINPSKELLIGADFDKLAQYMGSQELLHNDPILNRFKDVIKFKAVVANSPASDIKEYYLPYIIYDKNTYVNGAHSQTETTGLLFDDEKLKSFLKYFPVASSSSSTLTIGGAPITSFSSEKFNSTINTTVTGYIPRIETILANDEYYYLLFGTEQWVTIPIGLTQVGSDTGFITLLSALLMGNMKNLEKVPEWNEKCDRCHERYIAFSGLSIKSKSFQTARCQKISDDIANVMGTNQQYCQFVDTDGMTNDCLPVVDVCYE